MNKDYTEILTLCMAVGLSSLVYDRENSSEVKEKP